MARHGVAEGLTGWQAWAAIVASTPRERNAELSEAQHRALGLSAEESVLEYLLAAGWPERANHFGELFVAAWNRWYLESLMHWSGMPGWDLDEAAS